jgi:anoctamin-10
MLMKQQQSHLKAFFPLHDVEKKKKVERVFKGWDKPFKLDIDEIRNYYGEEVGLYFKFLEFYNKALVVLGVFGIIFFIVGAVQGGINTIYKSKVSWVMGIIGAVWSAFLMEIWKREEANLKVHWGTSKFEQKEQPRPEFKGSWMRSPVTGRLQEFFPMMEKIKRKACSATVIFALVYFCIVFLP